MKTLVAVLTACIALAGCPSNPMKTAQTVEQRADAAYGMFVIAQEGAVAIVRHPSTPQSVKDAIAAADRLAKPAADSLHDAILKYGKVKAAYEAAGESGDAGALAQAEAELDAFLLSVIDDLNAYAELVDAKRPVEPVTEVPRRTDGMLALAPA